jgi:eukaryotic-like serine/threonine-protein kinase
MRLAAGVYVGPYQIRSFIGAGGMGEVYVAHDTKLQRAVALKVLPERFASRPDRLARFEREARVLATLSHPNIAAIYDVHDAQGLHALVLELVDGPTLAERIDAGAIPLDEALAIAGQVARGLEAAHEHGIIHRDLKPSNIMVRSSGGIAIFDFGVARADGSNRTQQGDFLGTLMYMSPEQATGRTKEIDARTDMYALGVILFEIVKGSMPYDLSGMHTAQAVRTIVGTPPRQLGSPDRELDAICAQALSKQKTHRQESAAELARQIRAVIATLP